MDYFSFSIESGEKEGLPPELVLNLYFASDIQFIYGNLSNALRLIDRAIETSRGSGRTGTMERALFQKGRFLFEIGCYTEALDIFANLQKNGGKTYQDEGAAARYKGAIVDAWVFRCKTFLALIEQETTPAFSKLSTLSIPGIEADNAKSTSADTGAFFNKDLVLFQLENRCLAGDFAGALEIAGQFLDREDSGGHFLYLEQPDWTSGFTTGEILLEKGLPFWKKQVAFWQQFARLMNGIVNGDAWQGAWEETIRPAMKEMLPVEPLSTPVCVMYHYLYFYSMHQASGDDVEKNTALSLAFKQLQIRASRIDDLEIKRVYNSKQFWNARLFTLARENRLI
jgi:tetratricopeptide (TPR) repeat protein